MNRRGFWNEVLPIIIMIVIGLGVAILIFGGGINKTNPLLKRFFEKTNQSAASVIASWEELTPSQQRNRPDEMKAESLFKDAEKYLRDGIDKKNKKLWSDAKTSLEKALEYVTKILALKNISQEQKDRATDLQKSAKTHFDDVNSHLAVADYVNRANAFKAGGNNDQALALLIECDNKHKGELSATDCLVQRSVIEFMKNRPQDAEKVLRTVESWTVDYLRSAGSDIRRQAQIHIAAGDILQSLASSYNNNKGFFEGALRHYNEVATKEMFNSLVDYVGRALFRKAKLHETQGNKKEAIVEYTNLFNNVKDFADKQEAQAERLKIACFKAVVIYHSAGTYMNPPAERETDEIIPGPLAPGNLYILRVVNIDQKICTNPTTGWNLKIILKKGNILKELNKFQQSGNPPEVTFDTTTVFADLVIFEATNKDTQQKISTEVKIGTPT